MSFTEKSVNTLHCVVYNDWGPADARPIICIHGLTGNGHDFDFIAPALVADGYRLICIDLPGRGRSDFLTDPLDYNYDQYLHDIEAVIAQEKLESFDWLGVSLGGLLGMRMAEDTRMQRLILNDIGPTVPKPALDFIYQVIAQDYAFDDIPALETRMRETRGLSWGPVTDAQWAHMAQHNARELDDGRITYAYDPAIARIFETEPIGALDLWPFWEKLTCPILVIQGAESLLLTRDILDDMQTKNNFDLQVFENCGHVPSLMAAEQIERVRAWLKQ